MTVVRYSKIACVAAIAFYCSLVAFGNITDGATNYSAVQQTLMMKEVRPESHINYRVINNTNVHHLVYWLITALELSTALLCWFGVWYLFKARHRHADAFNDAKKWAIVGLSLGFLVWQVMFMSIGSEWFGLWMSSSLKGAISSAFQICSIILLVLIYLLNRNE